MKYSETNWGKIDSVSPDLQLLQRISCCFWPQTDLVKHACLAAAPEKTPPGRQTDSHEGLGLTQLLHPQLQAHGNTE